MPIRELDKHNNRHNLIVKSNRLINAQYKLTLIEKKIVCVILALVDSKSDENNIYDIHLKKLITMLNIRNNNARRNIIKILNDLHKNVLNIYYDGSILITSWFSSVLIDAQDMIHFEISKQLKPFLLELKEKFTIYHISHVLNFKSYYSIRIYEICKQFESLGGFEYQLDNLKAVLGLDNQYKEYKNFKRKVLIPCLDEINRNSDIIIKVKEKYKNRTVDRLKFSINGRRRIDIERH